MSNSRIIEKPHASLPRNPLIAEPLFRTQYIEKAGTGTTDMIDDCVNAGLPEPKFEQCGPHFVVTLWRDWLTTKVLDEMGLNERQKSAVAIVKSLGKINNKTYRESFEVTDRTALRDLNDLVDKGALKKVGTTGHQTYYVIGERQNNPT